MKIAGIKANSPEEASRIKWILGMHAGAATCGGISLAWLILLILFTSHEGECGGYEVQNDENLGLWHTSDDNFYIGYVCERSAKFGCSSGWQEFQGSCYTLVCESRDYRMAEEGCTQRDGQLVSISSEAENEFVLRLCGRQPCWIGLTRSPSAKVWQWVDGTPAGWFGNWTSFTKFASDARESKLRACLNKGPPERFIEEPVFIIKAVGKFVVPACLMFLAYLALKRKSTDMAQCLCIVDGFFAACLFAEMVIMVFRIMEGGPWFDVVAYVFFLAFASCGVAFCCACSAKTLRGIQAQFKNNGASSSETESMIKAQMNKNGASSSEAHDVEKATAEKPKRKLITEAAKVASDSATPQPSPSTHQNHCQVVQVVDTSVMPQAVGNVQVHMSGFDDYEVEDDAVPQLPLSGPGKEFTMESREQHLEL